MGIEFNVPTTHYAVELPGKGYYSVFQRGLCREPYDCSHGTEAIALEALDSCRKTYAGLGVPEVGDTARVVEFDVKLIRSQLRPLGSGNSSGTTE